MDCFKREKLTAQNKRKVKILLLYAPQGNRCVDEINTSPVVC